jgi:crotonobetainyl-CoA:carnitine CoA-transferase CaiB-like acyl-CoA transferase
MFAKEPALTQRMADALHRMVDAVGLRSDEAKARLTHIEHLIDEAATEKASLPAEHETQARLHAARIRPARVQTVRGGKHPQ